MRALLACCAAAFLTACAGNPFAGYNAERARSNPLSRSLARSSMPSMPTDNLNKESEMPARCLASAAMPA